MEITENRDKGWITRDQDGGLAYHNKFWSIPQKTTGRDGIVRWTSCAHVNLPKELCPEITFEKSPVEVYAIFVSRDE